MAETKAAEIKTAETKNKLSKTPFSTRLLIHLALLVALEIVLNRMLSINTMALKIGFAFVPIVVCAAAYGPLWAAVACALADVIGALLFPTGPFMPGITLSAFLRGGLLGFAQYGLELKPKSVGFWLRVALPVLFYGLVLSLVVNSYWLSLIYTKGFVYFFTSRLVQEAGMIPVQIIIIPALIALVQRLVKAGLIEREYVKTEAVAWRKISATILLGCIIIALVVAFTGLAVSRKIETETNAVIAAYDAGAARINANSEYLSAAETAAYLKVTAQELQNMIESGDLAGTYKYYGDDPVFSRAALAEWFEARLTEG